MERLTCFLKDFLMSEPVFLSLSVTTWGIIMKEPYLYRDASIIIVLAFILGLLLKDRVNPSNRYLDFVDKLVNTNRQYLVKFPKLTSVLTEQLIVFLRKILSFLMIFIISVCAYMTIYHLIWINFLDKTMEELPAIRNYVIVFFGIFASLYINKKSSWVIERRMK